MTASSPPTYIYIHTKYIYTGARQPVLSIDAEFQGIGYHSPYFENASKPKHTLTTVHSCYFSNRSIYVHVYACTRQKTQKRKIIVEPRRLYELRKIFYGAVQLSVYEECGGLASPYRTTKTSPNGRVGNQFVPRRFFVLIESIRRYTQRAELCIALLLTVKASTLLRRPRGWLTLKVISQLCRDQDLFPGLIAIITTYTNISTICQQQQPAFFSYCCGVSR